MRLIVIIISILLCVICVLLALLQHYYLNYKRLISVKYDTPVFEDLITTRKESDRALGYLQSDWDAIDSKIIGGFNAVINSYLATNTEVSKPLNVNSNDKTADAEAYNSLQAALSFKLLGKLEKAHKLFQHALVVAPRNPDVLNHYGEFLEQIDKVVNAHELYSRALAYSPQHEAALSNRQRIAPLVDIIDLQLFKAIDEKCKYLREQLDSTDTFDVVKKEAYYLHIYHTVSIEGNTLTLMQLKSILDTGNAIGDKSIKEHNEILGLEIAMRYVKLITRIEYIGVREILEIHRRVMGHVDPITSGMFRNEQVFVGSHVPPSPEKVPALMKEFVEWLNSEEAQSLHPVRYAALAHLKLVDIHPFSDGNGRTSRLLMNLILIKAGYPPVIIMMQERLEYYNCLEVAHKGDILPFVRFIASCTNEALNMYLQGVQKLSIAGSPQSQVIEMEKSTIKV